MRNNLIVAFCSLSMIGTVAYAAVTPATPSNKAPMAALILAAGIILPAAAGAAYRPD